MDWKWWVSRGTSALVMGTMAIPSLFASDIDVAKKEIRHVVVLLQENVSCDHYFGTYPHALNLPDEPHFTPLPGTPKVAGYTKNLLIRNPNFQNPQNGKGHFNPFRLAYSFRPGEC
jgi:phospholipase C